MTALNVATTINPRFDHVTPIEATRSEVTISHRCHVLAELMAVARSGLVDVVLVAHEFDLVSLESLQQLADRHDSGPMVAAISDVSEDRERLKQLGIPVASPHWTGPELVQWLKEAQHADTVAERPSDLSADELQFLEAMDPDHNPVVAQGTAPQQYHHGSGRRAAPYDPATDVPETTDRLSDPTPLDEFDETTVAEENPTLDVATDEVTTFAQGAPPELVVDERPPLGHVIAVWGPIGSPGVTTTAVNMAVESALAGYRALLIDADTYGAAVAVHLGLLDDTATIAQACRAAEHRGIDAETLSNLAQHVTVEGSRLDVITGLTRAERWPQLRAGAWTKVLDAARSGWDLIIVDCGFGLEEDAELSFDIPAPQRNATTVTAVTTADTVVAVGTGDPVGLVRLMKGLDQLEELTSTTVVPVMNKVSSIMSGLGPKHQLTGVWDRFGPSLDLQHFLPWAPEVVSRALLEGKTLAEAAPKAQLRQAVAKLMRACAPAAPQSSTTRSIPVTTSRMRQAINIVKRGLTRSVP